MTGNNEQRKNDYVPSVPRLERNRFMGLDMRSKRDAGHNDNRIDG
jgi:hypothetical protein